MVPYLTMEVTRIPWHQHLVFPHYRLGRGRWHLGWKYGSLEMLANRMANWETFAEIGTFVLFAIDNLGVVSPEEWLGTREKKNTHYINVWSR
ncbi:hypothetical protein CDAR_500051 [Caerostris darwini]|uniref:Uncharacterized protein n=1 Tax=Caerostris darwini TaxID=1538125 RepID=A0AAV4NFG3_9ARAC|nr:hypothetical protein CDAR_500051 [Caerostris darwini]